MDLEKFRCVFKFQKIITRSIFVLDKKVTWKKCSEYHFLLKKKILNPKIEKKIGFQLQKIITRKISIVSKNFTYKKGLRISFSIEKKLKKGGSANPIRQLSRVIQENDLYNYK